MACKTDAPQQLQLTNKSTFVCFNMVIIIIGASLRVTVPQHVTITFYTAADCHYKLLKCSLKLFKHDFFTLM